MLLMITIRKINSSSSSLKAYLLCDSWSQTDTESLVPLCVCQRVGVVGSLLAETGPQGLSAIQIHQGSLTTLQNGCKQYLFRIIILFKLTKCKDLINSLFDSLFEISQPLNFNKMAEKVGTNFSQVEGY